MIKARKKSRALSIFACILVVALFSSYLCVIAQVNGNITDEPITYNGYSNYIESLPRTKEDYTSSYGYNTSPSRGIDRVKIIGVSVDTFGQYSEYGDCTYGTPKSLPKGWSDYFPNLVNEYGYPLAVMRLEFDDTNYKSITVWWSPDSV